MTGVRTTIIENIKLIMKHSGYIQKDLVEYLHSNKSSVNHWFRGKCSMNADTLLQICEFLNVTPNHLYGVEPLEGIILNPAEKDLIEIRRRLNTFGQTTLDATAQSFAANPAMSADTEKSSRAM